MQSLSMNGLMTLQARDGKSRSSATTLLLSGGVRNNGGGGFTVDNQGDRFTPA